MKRTRNFTSFLNFITKLKIIIKVTLIIDGGYKLRHLMKFLNGYIPTLILLVINYIVVVL